MAELLTGDPNAMVSLGGMTPTTNALGFGGPCGYFWWSPCTFNNFNDWLNTLRARFRIQERNWTKLQELANQKNKPLSSDEMSIGDSMQEIKNFITDMKDTTSNELHRDDYYDRIVQIQSNLAEINALLELTQEGIEERDGRYITAGFARPKGTWGSWIIAIGAIAGAYGVYRYVKKRKGSKTTGYSYTSPQLGLGDVKIS